MSQETILIVEDNPILREGLQEMLELDGYEVFTAANGQQALDEMAEYKPDLILSDIAMPVMDGYEFFRAVRARTEWVSIPFIFLTARGEHEDVLAGKDMGVEDYLVKPVTREDLVTVVNSRLERSRELHVVQLQQAYETSLAVLANAIEVRDQYTRGHVERVMGYSFAIADHLKSDQVNGEQLRFGAMLHDIGKIHIRETTLCKQDSLSSIEWSEIQMHPTTGAEMIKDIPYLLPAMPAVRYHHERWDGSGYPEGLKGEDIPLVARIVSVADAFDAMTTQRPYSSARSLDQAQQEIINGSGSRYDPSVVEAFRKAWELNQIQAIATRPPEILT
jgi:putative two-component system response regulator